MKKTLLVVLTIMFALSGFSQQRLATLSHNDTITTFYGQSALSQAHAAAVNGDVITLSSGVFDAIEITKAVTIRGAGMWTIDSLNIENTVIAGAMTLNVPYDSLHNLEIEGMKFTLTTYVMQATNPVFRKCRMTDWYRNNNGTMSGAQFYHCVLDSYTENDLTGAQFINSVILNLNAPSTLMNCVARISGSFSTLASMTIYNSVVYDVNCAYGTLNGENYNSSTSYYSIGINKNSCSNSYPSRYFDITNVVGHHLWNRTEYNQVFKYFNGTYSEGMSFELQDDIATSILGDDGTQVGIYGGDFPFDPVVHPVIGSCHVARRTNADMKLEVTIDLIEE